MLNVLIICVAVVAATAIVSHAHIKITVTHKYEEEEKTLPEITPIGFKGSEENKKEDEEEITPDSLLDTVRDVLAGGDV